ncbi:MAG: hypothetical protein EOP84_07960, partial [Verrucomicrobiaceae bacterium]
MIEFLGRKDSQVKLRGYRVELAEVREAIRQNFKVQEVVVKLETLQKNAVGPSATMEETLLANLEKMSFEEADEMLN